MFRNVIMISAALICAAAVLGGEAEAQGKGAPGITDNSIRLCAYQPMTGSGSSYFLMGKGADAWYKHVNEQGGINGRKIDFQMADDGFKAQQAVVIARRFIERDGCFAITNPLGTPQTTAVIDYVVEQKVPLVGAGTGAMKNVYFPSRYVFPLFPSYDIEAEDLFRFAKEELKAKTVTILYQNDGSGKTHLAGAEPAAKKYGINIVKTDGYEVKEVDVSAQAIALQAAKPDLHICACQPEHGARFLTERAKLGWKVPVLFWFVGQSPKLFELAGKEAVEGVYFSSIFPQPSLDSKNPHIRMFTEVVRKYYPAENPDMVQMWGYAGAQVVTEAIRRMGRIPADEFTREKFIETLEGIKGWTGSIIPEVTINAYAKDASDHLLIRQMSWAQAKDGKFVDYQPVWTKK